MKRLMCTFAAAVLMIAGACSVNPVVPDLAIAGQTEDAPAQTDSRHYTLVPVANGVRTTISFVYTNRTGAEIHIVNCNGATGLQLEKRTADTWEPAWLPYLHMCLSPPIVVQPGEQYEGEIQVFSGSPGSNVYPRFSVDQFPGTYRIVWTAMLSSFNPDGYPFGEPIPLEERVSNSFELSLAGG